MAEALEHGTQVQQRSTRRENASSVVFFGDSYISAPRRRHRDWWGYIMDESTINITPHQTHDQMGVSTSATTITHSRGGLKLNDIATGRDRWITAARERWANNVPAVTVFCAGACDINNSYLGNTPIADVRQGYPLYVESNLQDFIYKCWRKANDVTTFDRRLRNHRFVICEPANWGIDYEPRTNVDPVEYRQRCTRAQNGINRHARRLWNSYSAAIFTSSPEFQQHRDWVQNHLAAATQERYIGELLKVVKNLLCDYCTPGVDYWRQEHQRHFNNGDFCRRHSRVSSYRPG